MQAEDLVVDESGQGQVVEEVCEILPHIRIAVLSETFIVKAVHLRDLSRLMVSTQYRDSRWVSNFEGNEEGDGFNGVVSPVDVVTWAIE